jgi:hypothetical protein
LTDRQSDMAFAGLQKGRRMQAAKPVEMGRAREQHGIVRALGPMAEAVEDAKNHGAED